MRWSLSTLTLAALAMGRMTQAASLFAVKPHPVVIWHGLGDSAYADGMQELATSLKSAFPGLYVHLVALEDTLSADQKAGFFGNVNEQVEQVCDQLASVPELSKGFDGIGFSQGGQFLRAYVQRCNKPAMRNLVTFGSQHQGVADLPTCAPGQFFCRLAEGILRGGINTEYAQSHVVGAQYFRNPRDASSFEGYLEHNHFLTDINNEVAINQSYIDNLKSLDNFVMLMFDQDKTVVPRESSWFSSFPIDRGGEESQDKRDKNATLPIPLRKSPIYTHDRLGLKSMDRRGALIFETCKGAHMQIDTACQMKVFGRWIGTPASVLPRAVRHSWAFLMWNTLRVHIDAQPAVVQLAIFIWLIVAAQLLVRLTHIAAIKIADSIERRRLGKIRLPTV